MRHTASAFLCLFAGSVPFFLLCFFCNSIIEGVHLQSHVVAAGRWMCKTAVCALVSMSADTFKVEVTTSCVFTWFYIWFYFGVIIGTLNFG